MKHIPNILTGFRILGSGLLLFLPVFSVEFYAIYLMCGVSDMLDGFIARKTHSVSRLGSQLDTAADLVFVVAASIKLLLIISLPRWLWIWVGGIAAIKIGNILWGYVSKRHFVALHTRLNKVAGLLLFLLPLTLSYTGWQYITIAVCAIATLAALQEGWCVVKEA